eukprot:jgi/Chlat1/8780/Chrsp90S08113
MAASFEDEEGDALFPNILSAGHDTIPIGAGFVFGGEYPDLFIVNGHLSKDPGLYLFRFLRVDRRGVPAFRKELQVTHPFKGLHPPPGCIVEIDGTIHGFWHVEENIMAHTIYDPDNHGFSGRGGDLILEVSDKKPSPPKSYSAQYRDPEWNPNDSDAANRPRDAAGHWRATVPHSALWSVRLTELDESPSGSVRRLTPSDRDIPFTYCVSITPS